MSVVFLGADFHDAPLSLLNHFDVAQDALREELATWSNPVLGAVVVATCNRAEMYVDTEDTQQTLSELISLIARHLDADESEVAKVFRVLTGGSVTRHLFATASGLESMVLGESEIGGQIKRMLHSAQNYDMVSPRLQRLFQRAHAVSKSVTTHTGVGASGRSLVHTALDRAQRALGQPLQPSALIIGTGAYARVVVQALRKRGVDSIRVYSRSGRGQEFAAQHDVESVEYADLPRVLQSVNWVISASGQSGYALGWEMVRAAVTESSRAAPLLLIDVALSADIDPRVSSLPGCTLITLDQLREDNPAEHRDAIVKADRIVEEAAQLFEETERVRRVDPLITALRSDMESRINQEVSRARGRFSAEQVDEIERVVRRVTRALLHTPTVRARQLAKDGREDEYATALSLLFDLHPEQPVKPTAPSATRDELTKSPSQPGAR